MTINADESYSMTKGQEVQDDIEEEQERSRRRIGRITKRIS
jgi:hypothetical protein